MPRNYILVFDTPLLAAGSFITKGELFKRAQGVKLNSQLKRNLIESLAVEHVALHEALAAGYDKNETYLLRVERETWPILKKIVNKKMKSGANKPLEYVKCRYIAFNDKNNPDEVLKKANYFIALLESGAKFDGLIKSHSSDPV